MIKKLAVRRFSIFFSMMLSAPSAAFAQINFSNPAAELTSAESSLNACAERQEVTLCLNALSHARMLRSASVHRELSADRIMANAVEILPLYMLSQLYLRDGDALTACDYANSGEALIYEITESIGGLMKQDPGAFKNPDKTISELSGLREPFDEVLTGCVND